MWSDRQQGLTDYQDAYSERTLNQLASDFTDIVNISPTQSVIPTCFKQTTIVPVPNNSKVTYLNDTSVAMKCFEKLVMAHINTIILDTLDPLQFTIPPQQIHR
jgi:hypothetical protein